MPPGGIGGVCAVIFFVSAATSKKVKTKDSKQESIYLPLALALWLWLLPKIYLMFVKVFAIGGFPFSEFRPGWFVPLWSGFSAPLKDKHPILASSRPSYIPGFPKQAQSSYHLSQTKFPLPLSCTERVKLFADLPWEIYRKFVFFCVVCNPFLWSPFDWVVNQNL